jgi:multicomponent Na+:H+ antiporter subunit F
MTVDSVLTWVAASVLAVAALLILVRIVRGPTVLDRVVALDVLVALVICALALEAIVNRHATTLPILITLSWLGFIGSVTVARYVERERAETAEDRAPGEGS